MGGYDSFINDDEKGVDKGDPNEGVFQRPPDSPDIDEIIDNSDEDRAANYYDQCIRDEVVLHDQKGERLMVKVSKCVRCDDTSTGEGNYNSMHDKSLYEVEYHDGTIEQLTSNITAKSMLSQFDSEGHHYQLLTEVTYHNKDDSAIAKLDGFIKLSSGNLHQKRMKCGW